MESDALIEEATNARAVLRGAAIGLPRREEAP